MDAVDYHPRYLAGIVLFNRGDYFEAHEVWEDLWTESAGDDKRFYQGLIQAAVGLCHFCNGNVRGAVKLYHTSHDYMSRCGSPFMGLDVEAFWVAMARCFAELLGTVDPTRAVTPDEALLPILELSPAPAEWPEPEAFLHADD